MFEARSQDEDGFAAVLAEYLSCIDEGTAVSRETFLANHPRHDAALREYFADVDLIAQLSTAVPNVTSSSERHMLGEFGDYDLLAEIGRGGMGVVYRARNRATAQLVALKMLLYGPLLSPAEVGRFRNEAATAANLDHPGIVPIFDIGERQGHLYYTMPLITGGNLAQRLVKGPLPPRDAAELLLAVADAVAYAHGRGVVHRDLKPANILLNDQNAPAIADFGLARQLDGESHGITRTGDLLGTPNYMAPEQVAGRRALIGAAVDIYAMGAVLYALLVGRAPFQSPAVAHTLQQITATEPIPPRQLNPHVPRSLETICLKCLEKSPADRYATATDFAVDLQRFLAGKPPIAQPVSALRRTRRWFVRNPVIGTLAAGIVVALITGSGFSLHYARQTHQREQLALANLYAADMNLAQQHVHSGAVGSAFQLLERHRPPIDGTTQPPWEWNYLWNQCHGELRRFEGPQGAVYAAAFSPDGRTVAAAGEDRFVWLWETATGKVRLKQTGHTAAVRDLAFAPDGKQFASVGEDGACRIWDTATGAPQMTLSSQVKPLTCVAMSSDGRFLATAGSDLATVDVWELATGKLRNSLDLGPAESVAFAPADARLAIAGRDGCIRVCECTEAGEWQMKATIRGHAGVVRKVAWSPDATRLATAASDNKVKTWDTRSWTMLVEVTDFEDAVYCLGFRPDGQRLVMAARNEPIKIWDFTQQQLVAEITGHSALVTSATYCPRGWRLLSASEDGAVRLWDAAQSTDHDCLEGSFSRVRAIDVSSDGKTLATGTLDTSDIILWDVQSSRPRQILHSQWPTKSDLKFSANRQFLASVGAGRLQSWNVAVGELVLDIDMPGASLAGVAWAPRGDRIAVQNGDGTISILDADSGVQLSTWSATDRPHGGIAFSPDGSELVTTSMDGVVRVWHVATKSLRHELVGHSGPVVCVAFSPQGALIASSAIDDTIRLWDARTGRHLRTLVGHSGTAMGLAFNPDSTRLASCSTDRMVKLWDVASGFELQSLPGHKDWALDVAFSPDGQTLASGGGDGTVRLWRARVATGGSPVLPSENQTSGGPPVATGEASADSSALREATALVKHLAARLTTGDQPVSDDPTTRAMLQAALTTDPTISDAVRQAATAQAKDCLLHWLPMCEGNRAAQRGDWPHAIAAFERAAALAPQDISLWRLLALASAAGGHTHAYENACRELCSRFGHAAKDADLHNFVVATLLMPPNGRDLTPVRPLVETFAKRSELGQFYAVLYQLRSDGKNLAPEAVNLQRFKIPPRPEECFILSLAWSQAGDKQRGTALYEAGVQMVRRGHPTNWLARAVSDPLQREAAAVLGIEPDGIGSDSRPASPVAAQDSAAPPLTEAPR